MIISPRNPADRSGQQGFSLVELSIVTAIILLLAMVGIPAIGGYIIENKVPKVGQELLRSVMQIRVNAHDGSATPYSDIGTDNLQNQLRDSSVLSVKGSDVLHGLGKDGKASLGPSGTGEAFTLTMDKVNHAACPAIASVLQRVAATITLNGTSVKGEAADAHYNALKADGHCTRGDSNTFTFVID